MTPLEQRGSTPRRGIAHTGRSATRVPDTAGDGPQTGRLSRGNRLRPISGLQRPSDRRWGSSRVRRGSTPRVGTPWAGLGGLVSASECHALRWREGVHASPSRCGGAEAGLGFDSRPASFMVLTAKTVEPSGDVQVAS